MTIPKKQSDISIGVSSWNTSELVEEALDSIVATASDLNIDVTVIDDASTDGGFAPLAEKFKNDSRFLFVRNEKNLGVPSANVVLEHTKAKYIVTLDSDARLMPGTLQMLVAFMEAHPEAGAITANLLNADGSPQIYYRRTLTPFRYFFTTLIGSFIDKYFLGLRNSKSYRHVGLDITQNPEIEQSPTSCLMIRREIVGSYIFDPVFRIFMPDVDLCKRIYDSGHKVYLVSAAKAIHLKSGSISKKGKVWLSHELDYRFMLYFKKHYPYWFPLIFIAMKLDRFLRSVMLRTLGREAAR